LLFFVKSDHYYGQHQVAPNLYAQYKENQNTKTAAMLQNFELLSYNCVYCRTLKSFETYLRKGGKSPDYFIPPEVCVMMNTIIDCKNKVS